jgi:hypothetical protein
MKRKVLLKKLAILAGFSILSAPSIAQITYNYTGSVQTYTVPAGIGEIYIQANGAEGGGGFGVGYTTIQQGGLGGYAQGYLVVSPGDVLQIYVGGMGSNGDATSGGSGGYNGGAIGGLYSGAYSGGGGGGASDVRIAPYGLSERVIVAGGAGGGGFNYTADPGFDRGGAGGELTGETGYGGNVLGGPGAGTGGSQIAGGVGGLYPNWCPGNDGVFGLGGDGAPGCTNSGGGGGGGYYGGGGGNWSGGGGGSSYIDGVTSGFTTGGVNSGNGSVTITEICAVYTASLSNDITVTADQTGDSYQWLDCDNGNSEIAGATNQTYVATVNGNYAVEVTNGSCVDTSNCVAVLSVSLEEQTKLNFTVYPNPSVDGKLFVEFIGVIESIEMIDLTGRKQEVKFDAVSKQIDASKLSNGTYIIRILSEGTATDQKVVIQK